MYGRPSVLSSPGQPPLSGVLISQLPHRQCGACVLITSETIIAIMAIIQPIIIETIVQFSALRLSQRRCREILCQTMPSEKSCTVFVRAAVLPRGYVGNRLKTITSKEEHALQRIWRWKDFILAVHNQGGADHANWMPCRCPHGPRTFSSGWIWIKTSRPMLQTESSSLPPPTHAARQAPKLELPALVSNIQYPIFDEFKDRLYHSDHRACKFHLFLGCNYPLAFQQHHEKAGYACHNCSLILILTWISISFVAKRWNN